MRFNSEIEIKREAESLVYEVKPDFPELEGIPIDIIVNDTKCACLSMNWNPFIESIDNLELFISRNLDNFYSRPDNQKKSIIAHEFGHVVIDIQTGKTRKVYDRWDRMKKGKRLLMVCRDFVRNGRQLGNQELEKVISTLKTDADYKLFNEEEILADSEAVKRGYGEGLFSFLKYVENMYETPSDIFLDGDPNLKNRIKNIEERLK